MSVLSVIGILLLGLIWFATPVYAQEQLCVPGTEDSTCVPCIPGPYNICLPYTDIEIGGVTIDDGVILLAIGAYLVGIVSLVNTSTVLRRFRTPTS